MEGGFRVFSGHAKGCIVFILLIAWVLYFTTYVTGLTYSCSYLHIVPHFIDGFACIECAPMRTSSHDWAEERFYMHPRWVGWANKVQKSKKTSVVSTLPESNPDDCSHLRALNVFILVLRTCLQIRIFIGVHLTELWPFQRKPLIWQSLAVLVTVWRHGEKWWNGIPRNPMHRTQVKWLGNNLAWSHEHKKMIWSLKSYVRNREKSFFSPCVEDIVLVIRARTSAI